MFSLKATTILGLVVLSALHYALTIDLSDMDFVHDKMMSYSAGTKRTVTMYKPKLSPVKPRRPVRPGGVFGPVSEARGSEIVALDSKMRRRRPGRPAKPRRPVRPGGVYGPVSRDGSRLGFGSMRRRRPGSRRHSYHGSLGGFGGSELMMMPRPLVDMGSYFVNSRTPKENLTFIEQTKTFKQRKTPSNKFLEAVTSIERGTAEAKAAEKWSRNNNSFPFNATKETLKLAIQNGKYQYAREKLGHALFYIKRDIITRPPNPDTDQASSYMDDLKDSLGSERFDEFLAVMGDVTLMFAIDTTGSMSDDIDAAKRIAVDVINHPRENPVRYLLSPFNDPKTGPVIFKNSSEGAHFVKAISELTATGGGDCPELTFTGILNALYSDPDWGSPLYVITDASAKDAVMTTVEEAKTLAKSKGVTVNFFTTGSNCGQQDFTAFQEVAEATSGQVLDLLNHKELRKLTGFTGSVLGGSNVICSAGSLGLHEERYSITVDDSMETMSVSLTTKLGRKGRLISLRDPNGKTITTGKLSMSKVSVYEIKKPEKGTWSLVVPSSVGQHSFVVKSTSDTNIDFEHYFMQSMPGPITDVPVSDPLIGQETKVVLTLAGYEKVQKNSTVLELMTKHGEHLKDVTLQPDNRGMRYVATFSPPPQPFKLKIKGTTKSGSLFERVSRNLIEPKHVLVQVVRSDKDFTLTRGESSTVEFYIFNSGANGLLTVSVKDRLNYVRGISKSSSFERRNLRKGASLSVKRGMGATVKIIFKVPSDAKVGSSDTAMVTVSYNHGRGIVMAPVQLLVVQ